MSITKKEWALVWISASISAIAANYAADFSKFNLNSAISLIPGALVAVGVLVLIVMGGAKLFGFN
jgi:ABC-type lipoprotein release transport system permease subunit